MRNHFKLTLLSAAVAMSANVYAQPPVPPADASTFTKVYVKDDLEIHTSNSTADTNVTINKNLNTDKNVEFAGDVNVDGEINIDGAVFATVQDKQANHLNVSENIETKNDLYVGESTLKDAAGNVGLNASVGDNNQQDVATAITYFTTDSSGHGKDKGGMSADAEIFAYQDNEYNNTFYEEVENDVVLGEDALSGASGNIGVNLASGNNHQQKSNMAISTVENGVMAEASVAAEQYSDHNYTFNDETKNKVSLYGNVLSGAAGNVSLNMTAGTNNQQATHLAIATN